jgi:hypothetical protein
MQLFLPYIHKNIRTFRPDFNNVKNMKKFTISMLILLAWTTSLPAQITREQADEIVSQYIKNEVTPPYLLYVNVKTPSEESIAVTTFQEEIFRTKYACWAYYLNENPELAEPARHRYLFVKENDGNLLEVITNNDMVPDLTQWTEVISAGLVDMERNGEILIYPNPTDGQLIIDNGQLTIEKIEIFDLLGKMVFIVETWRAASLQFDISYLPAGMYFLRITTENNVVTSKIIKN